MWSEQGILVKTSVKGPSQTIRLPEWIGSYGYVLFKYWGKISNITRKPVTVLPRIKCHFFLISRILGLVKEKLSSPICLV